MRSIVPRNGIGTVAAASARNAAHASAAAKAMRLRTSRGGRIRTGETSRSQSGRSTRLSYAPIPIERSHSMAVGADQLTLRDLLEDGLTPKTTKNHVAHLSSLGRSRKMVPLHRRVMKDSAAVDTRTTRLQRSIPGDERAPMLLPHLHSLGARASPVLSVVFLPAGFAPELRPRIASVELAVLLCETAAPAPPLHVVNVDSTSDVSP
jgi:hypothetical protein